MHPQILSLRIIYPRKLKISCYMYTVWPQIQFDPSLAALQAIIIMISNCVVHILHIVYNIA